MYHHIKKHSIILIFVVTSLMPWLPHNKAHSATNINMAEQYLQDNNYEEAINAYTTMIQAVDTIAVLYYGRGIANYNMANFDAAIADFTRSITLNNTNSNAFLGLANTYILNQQYDNATKVLNKWLSSDSNAADFRYCRAVACFLNNNYKDAISDFDKIINALQQPGDSTTAEATAYNYARYGRAVANYKLQNYKAAKIDLEECIAQANLEADYMAECKKLLALVSRL